MIDTPEKARAYGRLQTAIHRLYEAVANMDEGAIGDIARRVEVVADSAEGVFAPGSRVREIETGDLGEVVRIVVVDGKERIWCDWDEMGEAWVRAEEIEVVR